MIKNNKLKFFISSLIILLPALVGVLLWDKLPDTLTTHWGADGNADGFSNKFFAVFGLPLILLLLFWLCVIITAKDPKNQDQTKKAYNMVIWIIPVLSCIVNSIVYITAFNYEINIKTVIALMLGFMFIFIGNYLPKCKQNYTIGVKIKWTLHNEENWNATHRFTGKVWLICGILMLLCCLLPEKIFLYSLPVLIIPVAVLPFIFSYAYYKKQLKNGTAIIVNTPKTKFQKISTICALVLIVVVLIVLCFVMFRGNIELNFNSDSFTIKASYYNDLTLNFNAIDSVEYRDNCKVGERINGFGSARLLMGSFKNAEFGNYTRYSYIGSNACVLIKVDEKILVLGAETEKETKTLYNKISEKIK